MLPAFHAAQLLRLYASSQRFAARMLGCYGYGYAFTATASAQATRGPVATLRSSNAATTHGLRSQRNGHGYGHATAPRYAATQHRCHEATSATQSSTLPCSSATAPHFAGAGPPPYAPIDPGALPRAQRGLPLARSKLGFGATLLQCL